MKNIFTWAVAGYAIFATAGWVYYSAEYEEFNYRLVEAKAAIQAVDDYIEETMDTGEMDEFLSSIHGKDFTYYSK